MTKKKTTRRSVIMSGLALFVCIAMFIGSTYAWFTDSVTSAGNKIQSGTLKVDLELLDKETGKWNSLKSSMDPIFDYELWEPGYTDVKVLKVENEGNLALKWYAKFVSNVELGDLAKVIDVYVCPSETTELTYPSGRDLTGYTKVGTVAEFVNSISETTKGTLDAGEVAYLGIALKMQESAGNEYQNKTLGAFDIQILATQNTVEADSFDNQYDKEAEYPKVASGKKTLGETLLLSVDLDDNQKASVTVPAEADAGKYELVIPPESIEMGADTVKFDMYLTLDGKKVEEKSGIEYTATIELPHPFVDVEKVLHNGETVEHEHEIGSNKVTITVSDFSPFEVVYVDHIDYSYEWVYEETADGIRISKGTFVGLNPAKIDISLKADYSEYMVVDYVKNGDTYYSVSERATTVILGDNADGGSSRTFENGNYTVNMINDNQLYSVISDLRNKDHSTVYLLPGTYNEATTIYVYSSMDIIGLGDTEEIKVVKTSSSSSNRHLFNCNGTKADHIQVTLRNMTLDATAKTTNNQDNAAVQSIRKTKVKCYDLDIIKGTDLSAIAFYVNGNTAVDGVKYPAYLYVENCSLNTTRTFGVVTTSGSYKFYHNNLTYGGAKYTNNSGSIKNKSMAIDDWNWD